MQRRVVFLVALGLGLAVLGLILFSASCEQDGGCYRLISALRWISRALQML